MAATIDRVRDVALPILADLGLDLYDLELGGGVIRITVDRDGGVDLGAITRVTRLVTRELESREDPASEMGLEVSSPGLERTLRTPDHFRRARGMVANVKLLAHVAGDRRIQGLVGDSGEFEVMIGTESVAYADIDKARTVFEWGPPPKPGKGPKKTATAGVAGTAAVSGALPPDTGELSESDDEFDDEFDEFDDEFDEFDDEFDEFDDEAADEDEDPDDDEERI